MHGRRYLTFLERDCRISTFPSIWERKLHGLRFTSMTSWMFSFFFLALDKTEAGKGNIAVDDCCNVNDDRKITLCRCSTCN